MKRLGTHLQADGLVPITGDKLDLGGRFTLGRLGDAVSFNSMGASPCVGASPCLSPFLADFFLRLCDEGSERLATFHDEGVVALLDGPVDGREQGALASNAGNQKRHGRGEVICQSGWSSTEYTAHPG